MSLLEERELVHRVRHICNVKSLLRSHSICTVPSAIPQKRRGSRPLKRPHRSFAPLLAQLEHSGHPNDLLQGLLALLPITPADCARRRKMTTLVFPPLSQHHTPQCDHAEQRKQHDGGEVLAPWLQLFHNWSKPAETPTLHISGRASTSTPELFSASCAGASHALCMTPMETYH